VGLELELEAVVYTRSNERREERAVAFISIDRQCVECGEIEWAVLIEREERDNLFICPACGKIAMKRALLSAPAQMNVALPDGVKRKGFSQMVEAAKLEAASYDLPPEKRGDFNKAIHDLKKVKS
jgi:hypothetical protein